MSEIASKKHSSTAWKNVLYSVILAALIEVALIALVSVFIQKGLLKNGGNNLAVYGISSAAVFISIQLLRSKNMTILEIGLVCISVVLLHCCLNIVLYNGVFRGVGLSVLAVAVAGGAGFFLRDKKNRYRKRKKKNR